jgi:hypothetical protein
MAPLRWSHSVGRVPDTAATSHQGLDTSTRQLVCKAAGWQPEGVISDLDLIRLATPA